MKKIVIVGGGFGGVRAALDLAGKKIPGAHITLISDKPHFEYTPALYRVVTGRSPLEVCIPLHEIFAGRDVEVVQDQITAIDVSAKTLAGQSGARYGYDYLVLALGSETSYFNIPGIKENSFGFKSIAEALRLKRHLHEVFVGYKEKKDGAMKFVIIGAGASGVELAGELAIYLKQLTRRHKLKKPPVSIDLIEAAPRALASMPEDVSGWVADRLKKLGVNLMLGKTVTEEEASEVHLKDVVLKTKTVIWTVGVRPNHLYSEISDLSFDKKGKVEVNEYLEAVHAPDVYVIGDAAGTPYSGLAQTAGADAKCATENIRRKILGERLKKYKPQKPAHAIPVGPGWAAVVIGGLKICGRLGWWLRRAADLRFFLSILPPKKALAAFQSGKTICESCSICSKT